MRNVFAKLWRTLGLKGSLIALAVLLVLIVGLQNIEPASIDVLFWELVQVPKLYLIFGVFGFGGVVGFGLGWLTARRWGASARNP